VKQENLSSAKFFTITSHRRGSNSLSISIFSFLILFFISESIYGQEFGSIKGIITSEKGELLSGVTIQVKSTRLITQTNREGEYYLSKVPVSATLLFSRLGYKDLQLDLGLIADRENVQNILLISDIQALDEVHITERYNASNLKTIDAAAFQCLSPDFR
jgi:hypothetical protein